MNQEHWELIQGLFHKATELTELDRSAFLQEACGDDHEMLLELTSMLEADHRSASIIDRGLSAVANEVISDADRAIQLKEVGQYRLVRFIGEGGMGVVYLAQRKDAGNYVAIKFLLHAGLSPARRERFAREIKLLGKLNHPAIARLYDAGTLDDGTPWFVMEHVDGQRLLDHYRDNPASASELLRLFRRICEAVQYAHGQEIIHRDLKPSNIIVDKTGEPRLLDFGIAKELHALDEDSNKTVSGLRLLTPKYAAPEWVEKGIVGLFTDVYSLGVIFYQLLAGQQPVKAAGGEIEKPSTFASRISGVSRQQWNDLDLLCLKALADEPGKRYQSVESLLRDIDHYIRNEPLEAQKPTVRYRTTKYIQRNWRPLLLASAILGLFIGMGIFVTFRVTQERNSALQAAMRTKQILNFTLSLFDGGDKSAAPSKDLRAVTLVDIGATEAQQLRTDPETQADIYRTLGNLYRMLGNFKRARELHELALNRMKAALSPDSPIVADCLVQLSLTLSAQGEPKEAEAFAQQALNIAQRQPSSGTETALEAKAALGQIWADSHSYDKAISILEPIVAISPASPEEALLRLQSLSALANAELYGRHYDRAISLNQQALKQDRQIHGSLHPRVAFDLSNLASAQMMAGNYSAAETALRQAILIYTSWYGENNQAVLEIKSVLAALLINEVKIDEAETLLKDLLPAQEQALGAHHADVIFTLKNIGNLALRRGDLARAQSYLERALTASRERYGEHDESTAVTEVDLSTILNAKHDYAQSEILLHKAMESIAGKNAPPTQNVGVLRVKYGGVLVHLKRYREAEEPLLSGYSVLLAGPASPASAGIDYARKNLIEVYKALKEPGKAARFERELAASESK